MSYSGADFFLQKVHTKFGSNIITRQSKPYLIAEIGLNHNKDLHVAKDMIWAAADAGANAVKFQSYFTDQFIQTAGVDDKTLYSIFKSHELSLEDHEFLRGIAQNAGIEFFSTPLTVEWVDLLEQLKVPYFKVASGDLNNYLLLSRIVKKKVPILASTGNSSIEDIDRAVAFYRFHGRKDLVLMHCISEYPTKHQNLNLASIPFYESRYGCLVGFSDHSIGSNAAFAAVCMGAVVIEKHFTLDKEMNGPDHAISATPEELRDIREKIDYAVLIRGEPRNEPLPGESGSDEWGKRSLYNIDGKLVAMRPRQTNLPKDSDYLQLL